MRDRPRKRLADMEIDQVFVHNSVRFVNHGDTVCREDDPASVMTVNNGGVFWSNHSYELATPTLEDLFDTNVAGGADSVDRIRRAMAGE